MTDQTTTPMTDAQYAVARGDFAAYDAAAQPVAPQPQPRRFTLADAKPIDPVEFALRQKLHMSAKMSRLRRHNR